MMRKIRFTVLPLLLALVCVCLPLSQSFAVSLSDQNTFTSEALTEHIGAFIQGHEATTAGVSIAVIRGEETLYRTDYGYADIASQLAVDGDTVFEWGSVTKLLVWTSVMQLVEQGKLDLDAPISTYLPSGFLKRLTYEEPITMMNLMHHNAGWEDVLIDLFVKPEAATYSLEEALQRLEPRQSRKPGESVGYSNYGVALAGYIVERISGKPFYEYVNHHIFATLGIEHTSIHPTLDDHQWVKDQRMLSKGYAADLTPLADLFAIPLYPAGMATGTMDDFILFCKALLPAEGEGTPLFTSRETLDLMLSPTMYYGDTQYARNNHGFWTYEHAQPMLGHSGNTAAFSAQLLIHPESGIGFLVMTNQASESIYNSELSILLFGSVELSQSNEPLTDARTLSGVYQSSRGVQSGVAKLYSIMMTIPLPYATEDTLSVSLFGQDIITLQEAAPNIFVEDQTNMIPLAGFIYAGTTPSGQNTLQMPYMEFVQASSAGVIFAYAMLLLLVLAALECTATLLVSFVAWIIRGIRKKTKLRSTAYRTNLFLSAANLAVIVNIVWAIMSLLTFAARSTIQIHLVVNIAYIIVATCCLVFLFVKMRKSTLTRSEKARSWVTIIATLLIIANILYWNLCWF